MSLTTPSKLRELQIKLYRKAKNEASTGATARHQPLQSKWYSANWGKCSSAESGSPASSMSAHFDDSGDDERTISDAAQFTRN